MYDRELIVEIFRNITWAIDQIIKRFQAIGSSEDFIKVLKCHVPVELKLAPFSHENLGQLNTYVNRYRKNMMTAGDNPPRGYSALHRQEPCAG